MEFLNEPGNEAHSMQFLNEPGNETKVHLCSLLSQDHHMTCVFSSRLTMLETISPSGAPA